MGDGFSIKPFQPDLGNINDDEDELVEVVDALEKEEDVEEKPAENIGLSFMCNNCHTVFTVQTKVMNCVYCGGNNITPTDCNISSYEVIPFKLSFVNALNIYKKKLLKYPLAPFSMRSSNVKKRFKKIFLPCSLYDLETNGSVELIGTERIKVVNTAPTQNFESNYSVKFEFNDLLTSNYNRIPDLLLSNMNNYNFSESTSLSDDAWKDVYLINSSSEDDGTFEKVKDRVMKYSAGIVKDNNNHTFKKLSNNQLNVEVKSNKKVLVPIYFIHQKYNGKDILFLINGQTGKIIGEAPVGIEGVVILSVIIFLAIFLLSFLIAYFA